MKFAPHQDEIAAQPTTLMKLRRFNRSKCIRFPLPGRQDSGLGEIKSAARCSADSGRAKDRYGSFASIFLATGVRLSLDFRPIRLVSPSSRCAIERSLPLFAERDFMEYRPDSGSLRRADGSERRERLPLHVFRQNRPENGFA